MAPRPGLLVLAAALALPSAARAEGVGLRLGEASTAGCALGSEDIRFVPYLSGQRADLDSASAIVLINCRTPAVLQLDGGQAGDGASRRLIGEGGQLRYQLYHDPARTRAWRGGEAIAVQPGPEPGRVRIPVYGRIFGGQQAGSGQYGDIVTVTVTVTEGQGLAGHSLELSSR